MRSRVLWGIFDAAAASGFCDSQPIRVTVGFPSRVIHGTMRPEPFALKGTPLTNSLTTLMFVAAATFVMSSSSFAAEPTKDSLSDVQKNIAEEKAVLVDVREKREWDSGHVEDAILLPLSELKNGIETRSLKQLLPEDRIIYTHCKAGVRSCYAADILEKYGYEVRALKPGYQDLLDAGFLKAK